MEIDRLFSVPSILADAASVSRSEFCHAHLGCAAELLATAALLERGHRVALPVVDDDGVDLVVDYRVRVQVKSGGKPKGSGSSGATVKYPTFSVRGNRRRANARAGLRYSHVDVWMFFDRFERVFYIVPSSVLPAIVDSDLQMSPKYQVYREAWHVFSDLAQDVAA